MDYGRSRTTITLTDLKTGDYPYIYMEGTIKTTGSEVTYAVGQLFAKDATDSDLLKAWDMDVPALAAVWGVLDKEVVVGASANEDVELIVSGPVIFDNLVWDIAEAATDAEKNTEAEYMKTIGLPTIRLRI